MVLAMWWVTRRVPASSDILRVGCHSEHRYNVWWMTVSTGTLCSTVWWMTWRDVDVMWRLTPTRVHCVALHLTSHLSPLASHLSPLTYLSPLPSPLAVQNLVGEQPFRGEEDHPRRHQDQHRGRGVIENQHPTDVESPPPPPPPPPHPPPPYTPRVCMIIDTEGKACSDIGLVLVLNDSTARTSCGPAGRSMWIPPLPPPQPRSRKMLRRVGRATGELMLGGAPLQPPPPPIPPPPLLLPPPPHPPPP